MSSSRAVVAAIAAVVLASPLSTALALEAFGYGCRDGGLVFSVCAHLLACVVPVWKYGSAEMKAKYLAGMCNGTLIAVNGMTEPSSGSFKERIKKVFK